MNWLQLGGSILAILMLAGIAWALKLGQRNLIDEVEAMQAAEDALSGFVAVRAVLSSDKKSAMVTGADGSVAALKLHGAQIAVRRVAAEAVKESAEGWEIDCGERLFGRVTIRR